MQTLIVRIPLYGTTLILSVLLEHPVRSLTLINGTEISERRTYVYFTFTTPWVLIRRPAHKFFYYYYYYYFVVVVVDVVFFFVFFFLFCFCLFVVVVFLGVFLLFVFFVCLLLVSSVFFFLFFLFSQKIDFGILNSTNLHG